MVNALSINPKAAAEIASTYFVMYDGEPVTNGDNGPQLEIRFYGLQSQVGLQAVARLTKKLEANTNKKLSNMTVEQIMRLAERSKANNAEVYASICAGWENVPDVNAKQKSDGTYPVLPFTHENALRLFVDWDWLHAGIEDFLEEKKRELYNPVSD